jgi:hypothetical protein
VKNKTLEISCGRCTESLSFQGVTEATTLRNLYRALCALVEKDFVLCARGNWLEPAQAVLV